MLVCWEAVSLSPQKGVGATVWATVCWAAASGWVRAAVDTRKRHNLHGANAFIHQDTPGGARTCHEVRSVAAAMLRSVPLRRRPPDVGLEIRRRGPTLPGSYLHSYEYSCPVPDVTTARLLPGRLGSFLGDVTINALNFFLAGPLPPGISWRGPALSPLPPYQPERGLGLSRIPSAGTTCKVSHLKLATSSWTC